MSNEIRTALAILAKELEKLDITYGLIGAACVALRSFRTTVDIDLIVGGVANNEMPAYKLNDHLGTLPGFTKVDADNIGYYTPAVVVEEDYIFPLEIFEAGAWPRRPQYQQVVSEVRPVILPDGTTVKVFSPAWILREKVRAVYERAEKKKKQATDLYDIVFLRDLIRPEEYQVGVLDIRDAPAYKETFEALISGVQKDNVNAELLQKIFLVNYYIRSWKNAKPLKVMILPEELGVEYAVEKKEMGDGKNAKIARNLLRNGRVPAIIDHTAGDGFIVWESGAILLYLGEKFDQTGTGKWVGKSLEERAQVTEWLMFQVSGLGPMQGQLNWFKHFHPVKNLDQSVYERYSTESYRVYGVLEKHLIDTGSQWVALDRFTVADIAFYPWLCLAGFSEIDVNRFPKLKEYIARISKLPSVKAAYAKLE